MKQKQRWIWLGLPIFLMALAGGWYAFFAYHQKTKRATELSTFRQVSAVMLLQQFADDEATYTSLYSGKALEVTGFIKALEGEPGGILTVVLGDSLSLSSVRMVMDSTANDGTDNLKWGREIVMKGICNGYSADDMGLGADVLFNRATIVKK